MREYGIELDDIRAALSYAAEIMQREQHYPLAG
jgi:uncharacterized protein (DUF433 family)